MAAIRDSVVRTILFLFVCALCVPDAACGRSSLDDEAFQTGTPTTDGGGGSGDDATTTTDATQPSDGASTDRTVSEDAAVDVVGALDATDEGDVANDAVADAPVNLGLPDGAICPVGDNAICGTVCVDLFVDPANCGACAHVPPPARRA